MTTLRAALARLACRLRGHRWYPCLTPDWLTTCLVLAIDAHGEIARRTERRYALSFVCPRCGTTEHL